MHNKKENEGPSKKSVFTDFWMALFYFGKNRNILRKRDELGIIKQMAAGVAHKIW
jgi:hypothetical protein